jgi:hypothetical protein
VSNLFGSGEAENMHDVFCWRTLTPQSLVRGSLLPDKEAGMGLVLA